MMQLNLGSGYDYKKDFINVDNADIKKDLQWDLNEFPYPFPNESAKLIEANAVIEHLPITNQTRFVNECHRILKTGGKLIITAPHYTSFHSWQDIEHVRGYAYHTFDTFIKGLHEHSMGDYADRKKFSSIKAYFVFGKSVQLWNYLVEWLANRFPDAYEQTVLSAWPAEGVRYELTK